jgi:hypothetical protein
MEYVSFSSNVISTQVLLLNFELPSTSVKKVRVQLAAKATPVSCPNDQFCIPK